MSKKKWIIITTAMITMLLGIAGCGKNTDEEGRADVSAVTAEDLPAQEGSDVNADAPGADKANAPGTDDAEKDGTALPASAGEESKLHYIEEEKDLYGDIWEVGEGQFTVTEIYMETGEDGGEIMVAPSGETAGDMPKITVVYDDDTRFVKKKIWNGGADYEENEGSAADLKKGLTAEMNGGYEGDVFHATEILIVEVILN